MKFGSFLDLASDTITTIQATPGIWGEQEHRVADVALVESCVDKMRTLESLRATALAYQGHFIDSLIHSVETDLVRVARTYGVIDLEDYLLRIR